MGGIFGGGNSYQQQPQQYLGGDPNYFSGGPGSQPFYAGDDYGTAGPGGQGTDQNYGGGGVMYANEGGSPTAGGGGILDWLGSEKGQRAMQQLGGWSAGMLQGSAPSLTPRNFSTGLGAGMAGMQQAGSQYYQDALRRAQAQEAQTKVSNLTAWNATLQREADRATGLPPGYMPGGMPGSGTSTPAVANPPAGAGAGGGGSGGGGGGWGPLAQPAIGALTAAGVAPAGQQAIIAHGLAEGGFNTAWNVGDNGNSFGHWQFNKGGELPGYLDWAQGKGNPQDTALQAQYVAKRMEEIHPGFSQVTDPAQAMSMVADFERYKGYQTDKRLGYLADAQKAMGGGELEPRMPVPGSLADTAFQMPRNMAAGLGGPAPASGILPPAPAMPAITQPVGAAGEYGVGQSQPTYMAGGKARITPVPAAIASPETQVAAAPSAAPAGTPAAPRGKALAVGDSIALQFVKKGGLDGKTADDPTDLGADAAASRDPQQVLDFIDTALKYDPNYFRGKNVVLSTGVSNDPNMIDRVPKQLALLKNAGANVTVVGVGNRPGREQGTDYTDLRPYNPVLQRLANSAGAGFTGPLPGVIHPRADFYEKAVAKLPGAQRASTEGSGSSLPPGGTSPPPGAGGGGPPVPGAPPVSPAGVSPVSPAPSPPTTQPAAPAPPPSPAAAVSPGLAAGSIIPGARTPDEVATARAVAASAPPPPATPAPSPAAAAGPPGPPPPPVPGAAVAGPNAMPGSIAPPPVAAPPRPLPMPNLGQIQMPGAGGIPPYDVEAARRAQVLSIVGSATGQQVPAYLAEQAGLPNKAVEQQWAMQKQLYGAQLQAAQAQWNAASDLQKQQIAHAQGMETEQYKSELGIRAKQFEQGIMVGPDGRIVVQPGYPQATATIEGAKATATQEAQRQRELDTPQQYDATAPDGTPYKYLNTPRLEIQGIRPPPSVGGGPGTLGAPGMPGRQTGLSPGSQAELSGQGEQLKTFVNKVHTDAETARTQAPDLEVLARAGPNIDWAGPGAPIKQAFNRATASAFGMNTENVASYELAQQVMGGMLRKALRASDSNPTEKQQQMMLATFPTPESSRQGFQQGVGYMQGINDWQIFREEALRNWAATHNNSADGFQENFKLSAIPFVVQKMPQATRDSYFAQLKATDPSGKTLHRLADQMQAIAQSNYNYSY